MGGSIWLESEGLGKGTTCKMHISIGICDLNVKRMRNSPRVDKAALVLLTDLKVGHCINLLMFMCSLTCLHDLQEAKKGASILSSSAPFNAKLRL